MEMIGKVWCVDVGYRALNSTVAVTAVGLQESDMGGGLGGRLPFLMMF